MDVASVLVFMPCDHEYEFGMIRSLEEALDIPKGKGEVDKCYMCFKNIVGARNRAADIMLNGKYTHMLFLDSDMVFEPGTLVRLLSHDVDIVGAAYCKKIQPYYVNAFKRRPDGLLRHFQPPKELVEVDALGTGCMLIKRRVFEKMKVPFFYYRQSDLPGQEWNTTTEDIVFCENAIKEGFKVYVDGSLFAGHIGLYVVWPGDERGVEIKPFKSAQKGGRIKVESKDGENKTKS